MSNTTMTTSYDQLDDNIMLLKNYIKIHSFERIIGSSITIFLTTLEDAIWLIPFCLRTSTMHISYIHAILFVLSFTAFTTFICIITIVCFFLFTKTTTTTSENGTAEAITNNADTIHLWACIVGACLCWILAFYFYYQTWKKRQRKRREREQQQQQEQHQQNERALLLVVEDDGNVENQPLLLNNNNNNNDNDKQTIVTKTTYNSTTNDDNNNDDDNVEIAILSKNSNDENDNNNNNDVDNTNSTIVSTIQPYIVITLTIIGAMDELSYFPSLLLGNIFSVSELMIGTFIASCGILIVVYFFLAPCQPILHLLDQIPIYTIIGFFATIISIEVIWDLITQ